MFQCIYEVFSLMPESVPVHPAVTVYPPVTANIQVHLAGPVLPSVPSPPALLAPSGVNNFPALGPLVVPPAPFPDVPMHLLTWICKHLVQSQKHCSYPGRIEQAT